MSDTTRERPLTAVLVVGFNGKSLVTDCLHSLKQLDYRPLLVIYVDNDSSDGSLDHVRTTFPEVVAMPSGGNLGYCGGNNAGITRALAEGAQFVLILNPDTVVCNPGFVTKLVDYMLANPSVGKVGPKVYLRDYGTVQNTILGWPSIGGSAASFLGKILPTVSPPTSETLTSPAEVPSLNGCCLLVRAEALRRVGAYDADFWGYVDEVDWDWRAELAGWKRYYVPVESIIHLQKVAGYDFASRANYFIKRNTAIWYAKNGKWLSLATWVVVTLGIAVIRTVCAPFLGRSLVQYARFAGRLTAAYTVVITDVLRGRWNRSRARCMPRSST